MRGEEMKIGAFSEKYGVSQDTIRYYIKQKMLLPQKEGPQYDFSSSCERDLEIILELKNYQFSIQEIKKLLFYMRVSKLEPKLKSLFIHSALRKKQNEIQSEIKSLQDIEDELNTHIEEIQREPLSQHTMGVPFTFIENMSCPKCQEGYVLNASSIIDNDIIEGTLNCSCGSLEILDGIIVGDGGNATDTMIIEFSDYVEKTDTEHFQTFYSIMDWIEHQMDFRTLEDKLIIELGTGFGIFIRLIYNKLPKTATVVCVDYNMEYLKSLRDLLSYQSEKKSIVFMCSDFKSMPLKNKSIECLLDIAGRSNYYLHQYNHETKVEETLLTDLEPQLSDTCLYCGFHYVFKSISTTHFLNKEHRYLFKEKQLFKEIQSLSMETTAHKLSTKLPVGGRYENFYTERDDVRTVGIIAKR